MTVHPFTDSDFPLRCSTFLHQDADTYLAGHNLDMPEGESLAGEILINRPGATRENLSFEELCCGRNEGAARRRWTSKYGSITFCSWGPGFIDGGMNSAGLFVQEMTMMKSSFGPSDDRPRFFMMSWMQYVLDTFETVEQVLADLQTLTIDGWPWHFFLSDAKGCYVSLSFREGEPVVFMGAEMPYSAMCNQDYGDELEFLSGFSGFGGSKPIDLSRVPVEWEGEPPTDPGHRPEKYVDLRFPHAVRMLSEMPPDPQADDMFRICYQLDWKLGMRHWSYVIDFNNQLVWWETKGAPGRKVVDLNRLDWNRPGPTLWIDINTDLSGDLTDQFRPLTRQCIDQMVVRDVAEFGGSDGLPRVTEMLSHFFPGATAERLVANIVSSSAGLLGSHRNK
jgi:hypothetical protein